VAPQAAKSVLPVEDSFSDKAMRTFSRIRAHQSTSETQVPAGEKMPASVNHFAIVFLTMNKTCGTFP